MTFDPGRYKPVAQLNWERSYKPLDFGNGLVTGCVNDRGRLIALNTYHPKHGYVTLTSVPPFPNELRYDQEAVRRYRRELANPEQASFGFSFDELERELEDISLFTDSLPSTVLSFTGFHYCSIETSAHYLQDSVPNRAVIQYCQIFNSPIYNTAVFQANYSWGGRLFLTRASYTQLTEGGPLPTVRNECEVFRRDNYVIIELPRTSPDLGFRPALPRSTRISHWSL